MPFGLGFFATAGRAAGSYELISSTILTSSQASVTFSNLGDYSSTYKHLQIRFTARRSTSGSVSTVMRFNSDTGSNYTRHWLRGNGSSVVSGAIAPDTSMFAGTHPGSDSTSGIFSGNIVDILDAYATSKFKTVRVFTGRSSENVELQSGLWRNTNALTTIVIYPDTTGDWVSGCRFSLYGIKG